MYYLFPCGHRPMVRILKTLEYTDGTFKNFVECPVCNKQWLLEEVLSEGQPLVLHQIVSNVTRLTENAMAVEGVEE